MELCGKGHHSARPLRTAPSVPTAKPYRGRHVCIRDVGPSFYSTFDTGDEMPPGIVSLLERENNLGKVKANWGGKCWHDHRSMFLYKMVPSKLEKRDRSCCSCYLISTDVLYVQWIQRLHSSICEVSPLQSDCILRRILTQLLGARQTTWKSICIVLFKSIVRPIHNDRHLNAHDPVRRAGGERRRKMQRSRQTSQTKSITFLPIVS